MAWRDDVLDQNLWWRHHGRFVDFDRDLRIFYSERLRFERKALPLEAGAIYVIRGPRRVGKTVYLKRIVEKLLSGGKDPRQVLYLDCTYLTSRKLLRKAIATHLELTAAFPECYILLDEVTSMGDWRQELKYLHDAGKLDRAVVCLTGSASRELKAQTESMPGRGLEDYLLMPLSFREFALKVLEEDQWRFLVAGEESHSAFNRLKEVLPRRAISLDEGLPSIKAGVSELFPFTREIRRLFRLYLLTGGFPQTINSAFTNIKEEHEKKKVYDPVAGADARSTPGPALAKPLIDESLYGDISRYLLGDAQKVAPSEQTVVQTLQCIAKGLGSRCSYTALAKEVGEGVQQLALIKLLEALEDGNAVQQVHPVDLPEAQVRPKANKKIYFSDPFILHAVRSVLKGSPGFVTAEEYIEREEGFGALVESVVANHLARSSEDPRARRHWTFLWFYYETRGKGRELDFVYKKRDGSLLGIEVKCRSEVDARDILRIEGVGESLLLSLEDYDPSPEGLAIVPVHVLLALIEPSERNL